MPSRLSRASQRPSGDQATFDSYDASNMDLWYQITVHGSAGPQACLVACVFPYRARPDGTWDDPNGADHLRQTLHEVAALGGANTDCRGRNATPPGEASRG